VIQELDADGLASILGEIEGHLDTGAVVGGFLQEVLNHLSAAVEDVCLLPYELESLVAGQ
jgi:hypothetical protein